MNLFFKAALLLLFITKAEAQNNPAQTYYDLAKTFDREGKTDSAIFYYQKALANLDNSSKKLEANIRIEYGYNLLFSGFYSIAQEQAFKALKTALTMNDSANAARAYDVLGSVANGSKLYDKSIHYYEEGIRFKPKNVVIQLNLADALIIQEKDIFKAISINQSLLKQEKKNQPIIAMLHGNTAIAFLKLKNYDSAYNHILASWNINKSLSDSAGLMYGAKLFGEYYYNINLFKKAKGFLYFAFKLNKKYGGMDVDWTAYDMPELYKTIINIYKTEHNMDSVLWFKDSQIEFQKNLLEKQRKSTAEFMFSNQEDELRKIIKQEEQTRKSLTEYYAIALLLFIGIVIYFIFSGKDKERKFAPYLSVVVLILTFEFLLLALSPFINRITNGEPLYDFFINVLLALMLVPIQTYSENFLKKFALDIRLKKMEENNS